MKQFVEYLIKNLVNNPDEVSIEETSDEKGNVLLITLAEEDKPFIIGKNGRNIKAIRDVASIVGRKNNERMYIKIAD